MRLIDADELLKYFFRPYSNEDVYTNLDIKQIIDNASTVEARSKGEQNYIQAGMCVCPFCGAYPHKDYKNFCPNCGTDMRNGR